MTPSRGVTVCEGGKRPAILHKPVRVDPVPLGIGGVSGPYEAQGPGSASYGRKLNTSMQAVCGGHPEPPP